MLDVTTEVVYLPLKTGLDLSAGKEKEQWEDILSTIKRQPGAIRILWGKQIEHPDTVQLVIGMLFSFDNNWERCFPSSLRHTFALPPR